MLPQGEDNMEGKAQIIRTKRGTSTVRIKKFNKSFLKRMPTEKANDLVFKYLKSRDN